MEYGDIEGLRLAVVERAVEDYKKDSIAIIKHNKGIEILEDKELKAIQKDKRDIEKFFTDKTYFALFSDWDGTKVLNALKKQVGEI